MTLYMLDTDTCALLLRKSAPTLLQRIQTIPLQQQCISVVTLAELHFGVQVSSKRKANQEAVTALVHHVKVLDWPAAAAEHYAAIRADLKKRGLQLGSNDLMIAAHARSLGATVVTNNVKDFGRVKGLKVENWVAP